MPTPADTPTGAEENGEQTDAAGGLYWNSTARPVLKVLLTVVAVRAFPPPVGPETELNVIGTAAALAIGAEMMPANPATAATLSAATALRRVLREVIRIE